ncbi:SDR family oxidoreductase [Pleurocapsa sp. FMAR1]|uniref:SDR family oxidoreductase n=1 Tax=Pleurocapsa sp. FMAR1 TaxID=3040204 RepID=UPI0029C7B12C|nr:SDR family oxidoreductase [Pleurocapsa sp. FMAR1]
MKANVKIALVTGANKGLGFEISRQLAQKGCTILLGTRNMERGAAAAEKLKDVGDVQPIEIDYERSDTIERAVETIKNKFGRLDILVNNAGIADSADGLPIKTDIAAVERIFATNFIGTLRVVQAMLPLVKQSASGRIVNISSGLGSLTLNGDPTYKSVQYRMLGYGASKAALNMLTVQLASELQGTSIKVNSAAPGFTATDATGNMGKPVEEGATEPVRLALLEDDGPTGGFFEQEGKVPW